MNNKIILHIFILLVLLSKLTMGQDDNQKYNKYFAKDQLSISLNSTRWLKTSNVPRPQLFSRGINLQMMYPIIGNNSNMALAIGFGLACQNYYLDAYIINNHDSLWFAQIPDSISYSKYKLNTNYLTLPIEFRIRTNPSRATRNSIKFYPGIRAGMMVNVHTKYIGRDLTNNEKIKEKSFHIEHIAKFDYGISFRIGYGKFLVHAYYSLSELIEPAKGPEIKPVELGITLILF